jgi:oxalate decarboxylase/phosphoglucose isomerase-like protein (cupin superfamily)
MYVQRASDAEITDEYGCDFRRLYPWKGVIDTPLWGSAWATLKPGRTSSPHSHDEHETFIVVRGEGEMRVGDDTMRVASGDVVYLPPESRHSITNVSPTDDLHILCLWWGGAEADARMAELVDHARTAVAAEPAAAPA